MFLLVTLTLHSAIPSYLQTLQVLFKERHAEMKTKHHDRTGLQNTQENRKQHVVFPKEQASPNAKHFAYDGEKTLFVFKILDEHQLGTAFHVQAIDITNHPGFSKLFKITHNGFTQMIVQPGPVIDLLCTNLETPPCLYSKRKNLTGRTSKLQS